MNYCTGIYHGNVRKKIPEGEQYCSLCKRRIVAEKKAKKEKIIKIAKTIGKTLFNVFTATKLIIDKTSNTPEDS